MRIEIVQVSVTGGSAIVSLPGWPGTRRVLADGETRIIPAEAQDLAD